MSDNVIKVTEVTEEELLRVEADKLINKLPASVQEILALPKSTSGVFDKAPVVKIDGDVIYNVVGVVGNDSKACLVTSVGELLKISDAMLVSNEGLCSSVSGVSIAYSATPSRNTEEIVVSLPADMGNNVLCGNEECECAINTGALCVLDSNAEVFCSVSCMLEYYQVAQYDRGDSHSEVTCDQCGSVMDGSSDDAVMYYGAGEQRDFCDSSCLKDYLLEANSDDVVYGPVCLGSCEYCGDDIIAGETYFHDEEEGALFCSEECAVQQFS